eukprot:9487342-Pyramimonas_sp.AAC.1
MESTQHTSQVRGSTCDPWKRSALVSQGVGALLLPAPARLTLPLLLPPPSWPAPPLPALGPGE